MIGGRLDFFDARPVAALVYRHRAHVINVFVGQRFGAAPMSPELQVMQGFNLLRWGDGGLSVIALSDLNAPELNDFSTNFVTAETVNQQRVLVIESAFHPLANTEPKSVSRGSRTDCHE